jgi:NADH-quinone oxidoreductase subunit G
MVVSTRTPEVEAARAGVFEFLLVNHPLDCPVCDKGGECPLQDFSYTFGPDQSRMEFPRRIFDGDGVKADVDFGPTLMLNRNRCILCTRCVRFMREIDGDAQINIIDRGYGSEIATFQEEGVHSLISGNLMDVCPVGAITTRDYRFKSRPWDNPQAADTICTQCAKGCNVTAWIKAKPEWAKGSRLVRFTPRFNPDVNDYWMCDIGRFEYHWIEGDDRLRKPLIKDENGLQQPAAWRDATAKLADRLAAAGTANPEGVRFLLSAHASHEEFFMFRRLAEELMGDTGPGTISVSWRYTDKPQPPNTKFKVPAVDAPNVNGARIFGFVAGAPGDAMEDWEIVVNVGLALGVKFEYTAGAHVRGDIAARFPNVPALEGLTMLAFSRPMEARHWLQASNPSERWKWDFMYQDLPPVKGAVDPNALPLPPNAIPLRPVEPDA